MLGELPWLTIWRAQRKHWPHDLGDDIARLAHDDRVTRAHIFDSHLIFVMQRGHANRGPADKHWLEHCERGGPAGAPNGHHDVAQDRGALFGRELERDGPAGRT
ncbi:unannotated protein [freshwater metagenome]|uniref:Unannotated protein n=1 Tax=freshwater metagenome TaxID=449393 RepID=A0A6J6Y7N8_9ZZZZ